MHVRLATAAPQGALHAALRELIVTCCGDCGRRACMVVDAALLEHLAAEVRALCGWGGLSNLQMVDRTGGAQHLRMPTSEALPQPQWVEGKQEGSNKL